MIIAVSIFRKITPFVNDNIDVFQGISSCEEYDLSVTSVLQSEYSQDAVVTFITPPDKNIAGDLEPVLAPEHDRVSVRWRGWEKLSCIRQYQVIKQYYMTKINVSGI